MSDPQHLSDLGEFGLIRRIAPHFKSPGGDVIGIGDDCAVLPGDRDLVHLVTTDLLVEDVHFLRDRISPEDLGHKALAVNLSDIAAMGGTPTAAFLSIGLPASTEVAWLDRFFAGLKALADSAACPLLGGDTTGSHGPVILNITVLGQARKAEVKTRATARPGDAIVVTGCLGDSAAGLRLLLAKERIEGDAAKALVAAHHHPRPHLAEGQWLGKRPAMHAMMDVSDGIDSDLRHLLESSGVGATIDLETLPLSEALVTTCKLHRWSAEELAVAGGEDYCLLGTVAGEEADALAADFQVEFGRPLTVIGRITESTGLSYKKAGQDVVLTRSGFDHFRE